MPVPIDAGRLLPGAEWWNLSPMFLDHDMRSVPPRWEPPRRPTPNRRGENAAIALILIVSATALGAPIAGATLLEPLLALVRER